MMERGSPRAGLIAAQSGSCLHCRILPISYRAMGIAVVGAQGNCSTDVSRSIHWTEEPKFSYATDTAIPHRTPF
jgi:hypothetical protein